MLTKLPGAGPYCPFVALFLQLIFSDQSGVEKFPAKKIRCRDWLKNELQEKEQQISRGTETFLGLEIWLSSKHRVGVGAVGPVPREICCSFFATHFFSAPLFPPKGKEGEPKRARVRLPTPSMSNVMEDHLKHRVKIWTRLKLGVLASPWPATHRAKNEKVDAETSATSGMISSRYHTAPGG